MLKNLLMNYLINKIGLMLKNKMATPPEENLPIEIFDPRKNKDLAEVCAYIDLLKQKGLDNDYKAGIVKTTIIGQILTERFEYCPGRAVIFKSSDDNLELLTVGDLPGMFDDLNRNKRLEAYRPIQGIPKDHIMEAFY
jgi:hypothetical protein